MMNRKNRLVATFLVMTLGAALGTALVLRFPTEIPGRVSDRRNVCMVTDKVFERPQLPVVVGERTYYGCCAGCVGRLNGDRGARVARDPVTGREIDKSEAVILRGAEDQALYFESKESARRYRQRPPGAAFDGKSVAYHKTG